MKMSRLFTVLALTIVSLPVLAEPAVITAEQWAHPRSGEMIVQSAALNQLVAIFNKDSNHYFILHYRTGDEGMLWAEELRAWLVTLGIHSTKIVLLPDLKNSSRIEIELKSGKPSL